MPVAKITKRTVDAVHPGPKPFIIYDADLKGFGLRVMPSGAKSYIVEYRPAGTGRTGAKRRMALGSTGTLPADDARKMAWDRLVSIRKGEDPLDDRAAHRAAVTVADLAATFLKEHVGAKRKERTQHFYADVLNRLVLPKLGATKAKALTRSRVDRLHQDLGATPAQANRALAIIGSMYTWGARRGHVPEGLNPARGIERFPEEGRERFLSQEELGRLGEALREAETTGLPWVPKPDAKPSKHLPNEANRRTRYGPHDTGAIRLLLLTGCRLNEVLTLEWDHVDFERGVLRLPDSKTGRKDVVLNAPALAVLEDLRVRRLGRYVVAGKGGLSGKGEDRPRADLKKPWDAIRTRAGIADVRIHDLRHTHASFGAGAGLGLPLLGKLLGHRSPLTTNRYAHLDNDPLRRASNVIGMGLQEALDGVSGKNVVPLRREGAA